MTSNNPFAALTQDEDDDRSSNPFASLADGPPASPALDLDLGAPKPVKPIQLSVGTGQVAPSADDRAHRTKPTLGESLRGGVGEIANAFEALSVGAEQVPVVGPVVSGAKTVLQAAGAGTGALYGGVADPEAWTRVYDEQAEALAKRLGKKVEDLSWGERVRAMPGVGGVAGAATIEAPDLAEVVANAGKGSKAGAFGREVLLTAGTLGLDIVSDPTILLGGGTRTGAMLLKYAATGKDVADVAKGASRGKAALEGAERLLGGAASSALYGPEVVEGVLRGVEAGDIPAAIGAGLVGGLMVRGIKADLESRGLPAGDVEVSAELERLRQAAAQERMVGSKVARESLALGPPPSVWDTDAPPGFGEEAQPVPFKTPAEVRVDMMKAEGTPEVWQGGEVERRAFQPATVESKYEQARKAEAGVKATWDDLRSLAHQEVVADALTPEALKQSVTPMEEAIVNSRTGERRIVDAAVAREQRVADRRAAHTKLVASETGLPEDSPGVKRIVEGEIDSQTGLFGAVPWERDLAKHPEGAGLTVSDMGGTKFINDKFGHANGDKFIEAQGQALMEAAEEVNQRTPGADARGYRPNQKGDELAVLASTPEIAREVHQLAQEKFAQKTIQLELSDGTTVTYQGGQLDFFHGERARGEDPHATYKRIDELLEQHRKDLIARGERAPRGSQPLSLREVAAGGPPRAGGADLDAPPRAEAAGGEPPAGGEGEGRPDLLTARPPDAPPPPQPPTPTVHSHNHVAYAGGKEYFVKPLAGEAQVYRASVDAPIDPKTGQRAGAEWVGKMDADTQKRILAEGRADGLEADERGGELAEGASGEMRVPKAGVRSGSRSTKVAAEVVDQVAEERQAERARLYGKEPAPGSSQPPPGAPPGAPPDAGPPPAPDPSATGLPKYARPSSINLWQRIDHGEDALDLFMATADQFSGLVDEAKRGTMTLAQIQQLASNLGSTDDAVARALARRTGQALNAERLWAVNEGLKETARATVEHARSYLQTPETQRTPEMEAGLIAQLARHTAVFAQVSGANAEAGRALGVLNRIRVNADNAEKLQALIDQYGRSPEGARRNLQEIADLLSKVDPNDARALGRFARAISEPTREDKIYEYWINAILSGPPTHVANAISGVLGSALMPLEQGLAATVDSTRYGITKLLKGDADERATYFREMAEASKQLLGVLELPLIAAEKMGLARRKVDLEDIPYLSFRRGIREATAAALQAWKTEGPVIGETSRAVEMQPRGGAIGGELGRKVRIPTRALQATDQFFQALIYRMSLNSQAMHQAIKEVGQGGEGGRQAISDRMGQLLASPSEVMRNKAVAEAAYRTFNNDPGELTKDLLRFRRRYPRLGWIIPFMTTPVNIVKFGYERAPLPLPGSGAWSFGKALFQYGQGKIDARQLNEESARGLIAAGVALAVGELVSNGDISGAGPKDPAERRTKEAEGWRPYSIRVGDEWYGYSRIEPLGLTLRMTADLVEAYERGEKTPEDAYGQLIYATTRNLLDLPMISGLTGVFKTIMDAERYGKGVALRTASSFLPAIFGSASRAMDPERRIPQTLGEAIAQKVPGVGKAFELAGAENPVEVARALDIYGRPELLEDSWFERLASPFRRSPVRQDVVTPHLIRLGINLGSPSKKLDDWKDPATGQDLPQPQGRDAEVLAQARGIARYAMASMVTSQQDFMLLPQDQQEEVLRGVLARASMVVTRRAKGLLYGGQRLSLQELVGELMEQGPPELK